METGISRPLWTSGEFFVFVCDTIAVIRAPFLIAYDSTGIERAQLLMVLRFPVILPCLLLQNGHNSYFFIA